MEIKVFNHDTTTCIHSPNVTALFFLFSEQCVLSVQETEESSILYYVVGTYVPYQPKQQCLQAIKCLIKARPLKSFLASLAFNWKASFFIMKKVGRRLRQETRQTKRRMLFRLTRKEMKFHCWMAGAAKQCPVSLW